MDIFDHLIQLHNELKRLRTDIVKLGPSRRTGPNYDKKLIKVHEIYNEFKLLINKLPAQCPSNITDLCSEISNLYVSILQIESKPESSSSSDCEFLETMANHEKFCLKTAVSLLPKMNGNENVTRELIDAIELYDSMLGDDNRTSLINFILKTRLTQGAKMRLSPSYAKIADLVKDMRIHLLTRKSDTALQSLLQNCTQGNKSVADFGAEIEQLFTDLTISQAENDPTKYNILRPINEKNAIKRFSDGLRSQRLSTIIASRNYSSLKDAIRAAEDEAPSSTENVMTYQNRNYNRGYLPRFPRGGRGHFQKTYNNQNRSNNYNNVNHSPNATYCHTDNITHQAARGRGSAHRRGQHFRRGNNNFYGKRDTYATVNMTQTDTSQTDSYEDKVEDDQSQFFRP